MEVLKQLKKRYYGACVQYGKIEQKVKLDDKGVLPDRKHISVLQKKNFE